MLLNGKQKSHVTIWRGLCVPSAETVKVNSPRPCTPELKDTMMRWDPVWSTTDRDDRIWGAQYALCRAQTQAPHRTSGKVRAEAARV